MNNENTKIVAIDGSSTASEDLIVIRNFDSSELNTINTDEFTEEYVLFASDVMEYIDKDNYMVTTANPMSPRSKSTSEPQHAIAPNLQRKDDTGQQFLQTNEDHESTQGSSEMNEIELVLLPSSQEDKSKVESNLKALPSGAIRLQASDNIVRPQVPNSTQNRISKNTAPAAVINSVNVSSAVRNQPVILTTTKKLMSEVTQTTAKVSIGNTTISVPLLKQINSSQIQTTSLFSEAQKSQQPLNKLQKSPQQKQQLNFNKILNVKRSCSKVNPPTIMSLSQLQVKPMSTTKIVQAKVVGNKMQLQIPNTGSVTTPSPTTSSSGHLTITAPRPKSNILQNVSFIKSPTKKETTPALCEDNAGNVPTVSSKSSEQLANSVENISAPNCGSAKLKNTKDSQAELKATISSIKRTDGAVASAASSSLRNLKTTNLNPTCTTTVKKILASASMHNSPPLLMPLCKSTEPHQIQTLVNAKRSGIGSTVSIIKQGPPNAQLITIAGAGSGVSTLSVTSSELRPLQSHSHSGEPYEMLTSKTQPIVHTTSESVNKISASSLISMPRNISVLLTKNDGGNHQMKAPFSSASNSTSITTHSNAQTEQLAKKLNICRTGSLNITAVSLPQSLANTSNSVATVTTKAVESITMKSPIVSVTVSQGMSLPAVQTVESNANITNLNSKQTKVPASTAAISLFGVPSLKRPRMSETEASSDEKMQTASIQVKRKDLDGTNLKSSEPAANETPTDFGSRSFKESLAALNEKNTETKPQTLSQTQSQPQPQQQSLPQLPTVKQEDTQNVLLKQLLQNASSSATVTKSPSPPVCSQVLSARKVINVRAPSLGLVSSLEAQLARPVLPPVPTALTSQITMETSSLPKTPVQKTVSSDAEKSAFNDVKQKAAVQIISKETSFVSSPSVGINKPQILSNGGPIRSHQSDQSASTTTSATGQKATSVISARLSETLAQLNHSMDKVQNEACGPDFDKKSTIVKTEQPEEQPNASKLNLNENSSVKNHNQQTLSTTPVTNLGAGTPSNTLSNMYVQQLKILPEAASAESTLTEKSCTQTTNSKPTTENLLTAAENAVPTNKEKSLVQKSDASEPQVSNSSSKSTSTTVNISAPISISNSIGKPQPIALGTTATTTPAHNSSSDMLLQRQSSSDNMFQNVANAKRALAKDQANTDVELRKKRKRDYQKHRRQFLNNNKEVALSGAGVGAAPSTTGVSANKKRPRKLLKVEEDYDSFNENLMSHIRQMQPLQVLEPVLSRNYSACKMYGKSRNNKESSTEWISGDGGLLGEFGSVKLGQVEGLYEKEPLIGAEKDDDNRSKAPLSIQNDFYDQEFLPIMSGNEQEKMQRFIGAIREKQIEPLDIICSKNNNFSSATDSQQISKWNTFACLTYPGLILRHSGSNQCFGRMSPVIPYVEPNVQSSPNLPLRFLTEEVSQSTLDEKPPVDILKIKRETSDGVPSSQKVVLSLSPSAVNNVIGVLQDLANLLNIATPTNFKIIDSTDMAQNNCKIKPHKLSSVYKRATLLQILNGRSKICAKCGRTIESDGIRCSKKAFENCIVSMLVMPSSEECSIYFCSRSCYKNTKNPTEMLTSKQQQHQQQPKPDDTANNQVQSRLNSTNKTEESEIHEEKLIKKRRFKYFSSKCFTPAPHIKHLSEKELVDILFKMNITVSASTVVKSISGTPILRPIDDMRQCCLCRQQGDGVPDGPSRLLNFDIDKYVHLNCALWSNGVYETISGGLMNLTSAVQVSLSQSCSACQQIGATVKCFKNRCGTVFHLPCALKKGCVFYKNKTIHCQQHATRTEKENELTCLSVYRRVFIERDENRQVASVMHHSELSNLLRVGSLTFLNVGQLLPHQLEAFHNNNYIYPIGYKITRFYWSMNRPNKRCRYVCSIADVAGKPEFRIQVQEPNESEVELQDTTPSGVWQKVLDSIAILRKKNDLVQLFPRHISGEDLFGLTEPAIVRIIESLPGVESLTDYRFKYGRNPLLELPLAINPSGAARTEQKQRQIMGWRKPHTQRTGTFSNHQRVANSVTSVVAGEVTCPYSKQFVHSKSSQYKKMKQEWRNNVYLARSKIQGLGLYAARDMERHTMIIEYIGEVIRTEVSEIREKQYESRNRGIYMFRLDEERVVDATLSGGLARYINHSCNPNCVTEIVEVDRELRIIIFAKRRINRGEELSYDYKFDIEDDANKIQCMCGAPNCRKWMN